MEYTLLIIAAVLFWFGIDAFILSRHVSPPSEMEKDDLMFGKRHKRPISDWIRQFTERRYPIATANSMRLYGSLFIVAGLLCAWLGFTTGI